MGSTSSMMVHPQNSTETPSKVLLNTSEPCRSAGFQFHWKFRDQNIPCGTGISILVILALSARDISKNGGGIIGTQDIVFGEVDR